ncbi:unnamed protein product [Adineta ricciae]|uniref:PiggyBac transposable element-derived protein 4-like protein n=1 Tax=Adineta ricciae TaxID=249248 RepID=A0A815CWH8_ADIRI|nr:unnamed protein product [Adineta ricciae]
MATSKKRSYNEIDEISSDESETESEIETDGETGSEDDSGNSDVEDDENTPSVHTYNHTSKSWQKGNFGPTLFSFQDNNCGVTANPDKNTLLDFFKIVFDQELIQVIADKTNQFQVDSADKHSSPHQAKWYSTNLEEIYLFLATFMLMAHIKKFRIKDYWSVDPLIATPIFSDIMPRDRFLLLLKYLHFTDLTQPKGDRLYKIKFVVQHLKEKFKQIMIPYRNLCIDESLVLWKGRLSFKQYIPSKRRRFGIKLFVLCDCRTGFILDFVIYTGSQTEIQRDNHLGIPGSIIMTLMQPYLQRGHNLFVDNWYTSPRLFELLHANSTGACITVRRNRIGMPDFTNKLKRGEYEYQHTDILLCERWFDKREVTILSTTHKPQMASSGKVHYATGEQIQKPESVKDYIENMSAVDRSDMQISYVECVRKTVKWYKKLFFHLLDISILNSHILYKQKTGRTIHSCDFRLQLIRQIIETYGKPKAPTGRPTTGDNPVRLIARHFPSLIPSTLTKQNPQRKCVVCAKTTRRTKKRTDSRYECTECDVGLCVSGCFQDYHTLKYF